MRAGRDGLLLRAGLAAASLLPGRAGAAVPEPLVIENERVRVVWEATPVPRLRVEARAGDGWVPVSELAGEALRGARLFTTAHPAPDVEAPWTAGRPDARTLVLASTVMGRPLERVVRLDPDAARLHVATSVEMRGDELTEWLQDRWTFAAPGPLDFAWAPALRPGPDLRIGAHAFRAPAVVLMRAGRWAALVPDLDTLAAAYRPAFHTLDLDVQAGPRATFAFGIERADPVSHVAYRHDPAMLLTLPAGRQAFAYDLLVGAGAARAGVLRAVTAFHWQRYAARFVADVRPQTLPFPAYAARAYPTLFGQGEFVAFRVGGREAGGFRSVPAHAAYFRRPEPVVWNQVWFNGQRSAYGLRYFAAQAARPDWAAAAARMTAFSLAAPRTAGLFPALYAFADSTWWGSIPRLNGGRRRIHVADAAWTATWLLWWARDLAPEPEADPLARGLADFLVAAQQPSGAIPAWFDLPEDGGPPVPDPTLAASAETGSAALFLAEVAGQTGAPAYREALVRAADFLAREVVPAQAYRDFEAFFSCAWKPLDLADPYTGLAPHNTYSAYWAAHALLRAHELTGRPAYLAAATEALDVLSLYQQVWNPPFLSFYAFGGFGVMNTDGEWSDARQAVFAPLYLDFYRVTGEAEFFERGVAALRASFALMSIPENREVSPRTFDAYPEGLMPENYAHAGVDGTHGRSDAGWGEAGALAAAALVDRHYGGLYVDVARGRAFGIDGVRVLRVVPGAGGLRVVVAEALGRDRTVTLVTDGGLRQPVALRAGAETTVTVPS